MKKILIFALIAAVGFSLSGQLIFAQTSTDVETERPGVLPTNPLYFLKELTRGVQSFFTFNPVAKARLELRFANERAAEVEVLAETEVTPEGIERAVEKYQANVERLKARLQSLEETSENSNVDDLLTDLTERAFRHQQLFDDLKIKFSELEAKIELAQEALEESVGRSLEELDGPEKLKVRLEAVFKKADQTLPELEGLVLLSRLADKVSRAEIKSELRQAEEKLVLKFEGKVEAGEIDLSALAGLIKDFPKAEKIKIEILDTLREEVSAAAIKNQLNVLRQNLLAEIEAKAGIKEDDAAEEIEDAVEEVGELEALAAAGTISGSVRQLLEQAKFNLEQAQRSFAAGDYGRAFGQATSAKAMAKNAIRQLEKSAEDIDEEIEELKEDFDELKAEAGKARLTAENSAELYTLFSKTENKIVELLENPSVALVREVRTMLASIESIIKRVKEIDDKDFEIDIEDELDELEKLEEQLNGQSSSNNWSVEIKEGRFNPPTLKIKKGDTVTWVNADGSSAWPASAVHPTHTVYPGSSIEKCRTAEASKIFDACHTLTKGESWSFIFNEVGTWKYHNHVLGGSTGVIEVTE